MNASTGTLALAEVVMPASGSAPLVQRTGLYRILYNLPTVGTTYAIRVWLGSNTSTLVGGTGFSVTTSSSTTTSGNPGYLGTQVGGPGLESTKQRAGAVATGGSPLYIFSGDANKVFRNSRIQTYALALTGGATASLLSSVLIEGVLPGSSVPYAGVYQYYWAYKGTGAYTLAVTTPATSGTLLSLSPSGTVSWPTVTIVAGPADAAQSYVKGADVADQTGVMSGTLSRTITSAVVGASFPASSASPAFTIPIVSADAYGNVITYTNDVDSFSAAATNAASGVACVAALSSTAAAVPCLSVAFSSSLVYLVSGFVTNASTAVQVC